MRNPKTTRPWKRYAIALAAIGAATAPFIAEMRIARAAQPLTDRWQTMPVAPRGATLLGLSIRPRQMETLGLELGATITALLRYPYQIVRLGAYWQECEPSPGEFRFDELDFQMDATERAGKQILLCVGAVKTFGYPEFFAPAQYRPSAFVEGTLITPAKQPQLLNAAREFVTRVVERYRSRSALLAWQVEHEAVDPLGVEHSWRLSASFLQAEIESVRAADPTRPVVLNGFLPTVLVANVFQWWRTRDQGDSLAVAQRFADIVGIDYYPRYALAGGAGRTLYADGSRVPWQQARRRQFAARLARSGQRLMITEGQAEPWETVTNPPNPSRAGMYSCLPEHLIENYNHWLSPEILRESALFAYLFWGAEYWVQRQQSGDPRYLKAFARILEQSA